ncbi:MAG: hypothetical protein V3R64_06070 [Sphingomonadales bacterium]
MSHAIFLVLIAFGGLFYMKFMVEEKEQHLSTMKAEYLADQKALRVLKAEWAYLNSPEYLQTMAEKYLMLKPLGSKQVVTWFDEVPNRPYDSPALAIAFQNPGGENSPLEKISSLPPGEGEEP